jgi:hypothetical protein
VDDKETVPSAVEDGVAGECPMHIKPLELRSGAFRGEVR